MSRMMISPHDRTEGIPTSKGSAGTNATADALEADRQRNMPAGLRGRHHELPTVQTKAAPRTRTRHASRKTGTAIKCELCGVQIVRRNERHKYCERCRAKARRDTLAKANEKRYAKDRLASVSESISMRTVR